MSAADIIILIILAIFVWKGIRMGLIEAVGGIVGLFVGAFMAGKYYPEVAEMIKDLLFGSEVLAVIIGFLLVFILVNRAVAILFWVVDKIFHIIAIIPFLKTFNRLLGGILGLLEGLLFAGIIIYFLSLIPFTGTIQDSVADSRFAPFMEFVGKIADPFLPDTIIDSSLKDMLPEFQTMIQNFNPGSNIDLNNLPIDLNDITPEMLEEAKQYLTPEQLEQAQEMLKNQ